MSAINDEEWKLAVCVIAKRSWKILQTMTFSIQLYVWLLRFIAGFRQFDFSLVSFFLLWGSCREFDVIQLFMKWIFKHTDVLVIIATNLKMEMKIQWDGVFFLLLRYYCKLLLLLILLSFICILICHYGWYTSLPF